MEKDITQSIARYIEDKMKYFSDKAIKDEMKKERENIQEMIQYVLDFVCIQKDKKSPFNMKSFEAGTHFFAYPVIQVPNIRTEEYEEENIVELLSLLMGATSMISDVLPNGQVFTGSPFITFRSEEFTDKMMSRFINSELISSTDTNLLSILFAKNSLCDSKKHSDHKS